MLKGVYTLTDLLTLNISFICYQGPASNQQLDVSSSGFKCALPVPLLGEDTWDYNRHRWSKKISNLCAYEWYVSFLNAMYISYVLYW
jgi:hypothetical protein